MNQAFDLEITDQQHDDLFDKTQDTYDSSFGDNRRLIRWLFLSIFLSLLLTLASFVMMLGSFFNKEYVVFLAEVDKQTGLVNLVRDISGNTVTAQEAMDRHFIAKFVRYRENYGPETLEHDQRIVHLFASNQVGKAYELELAERVRLLKRTTIITANVKNISFLSNQVAHVRFKTTSYDNNTEQDNVFHWVAILKWDYVQKPITDKDRLENFAGFIVKSYRVDMEIEKT